MGAPGNIGTVKNIVLFPAHGKSSAKAAIPAILLPPPILDRTSIFFLQPSEKPAAYNLP
jgi:hypothetical protein